jgi:hypothetical protein
MDNGFSETQCVTDRHVRPLIALAEKMRQCVKKIRNASFLEFKVAKPFPGSWKMDDGGKAMRE